MVLCRYGNKCTDTPFKGKSFFLTNNFRELNQKNLKNCQDLIKLGGGKEVELEEDADYCITKVELSDKGKEYITWTKFIEMITPVGMKNDKIQDVNTNAAGEESNSRSKRPTTKSSLQQTAMKVVDKEEEEEEVNSSGRRKRSTPESKSVLATKKDSQEDFQKKRKK